MTKVKQIFRYHQDLKGTKQISELTGVARNTIKKYLRKFREKKLSYEWLYEKSDHELEQFFAATQKTGRDHRAEELKKLLPDIEKKLRQRGMTLTLAWKQYLQAHPGGFQLTSFYHYYNEYARAGTATMHIVHKAGDKLYIDFTGEKLHIIERETGEQIAVEVFIAILGCSQLTYVEAMYSQKKEDLVLACENALHYIGGVPAGIVPDNLKSAVTRSSRYEPVINELFAAFAAHYNTAVIPARAYRPRDKALVEGMVKIIYRRIYAVLFEKEFFSLEELNKAIAIELENHNNAPFKQREYSRRQRFMEVEQSTLQPLPALRFELRQMKVATVMKNGHALLTTDKHYYSVPHHFIGKRVKLLFTVTVVEIFFKHECIATHKRNYIRHTYTTQNEHMASTHQFLTEQSAEKFIATAQAIHEDVARYIEGVFETKKHPEQSYKSCAGILSFEKRKGKQRLIAACRRAMDYGLYGYRHIENILEKKLDLPVLQQEEILPVIPIHNNIRGSDYYQ